MHAKVLLMERKHWLEATRDPYLSYISAHPSANLIRTPIPKANRKGLPIIEADTCC